jgi:hypothetical protein
MRERGALVKKCSVSREAIVGACAESGLPLEIRHDRRVVAVRYSSGSGVPYLESWEDNVLRLPDSDGWPPALLKQVTSYVARRSWFTDKDADALAARLGKISKFQSLSSEDAVTWSWFGTLGRAGVEPRRRTVQWLYDRLGLQLRASPDVRVDQWMRVIHPNALKSSKGPELDARIDDPGVALVYVEAKWDAALGSGKGAAPGQKDDQVILRRDALRAEPRLAKDDCEFIVLGVSNTAADLAAYDEVPQKPPLRHVHVKWLTWAELSECDAHPLAREFRRYLEWKREFPQRSPH